MIGGAQADQDVVWRELADRIAERSQGVVSPHLPGCLDVHRLELAKHRAEPPVRYSTSRVGITREPLQATGERGRNDENVRSADDERPD
jgi:hypothetical protein